MVSPNQASTPTFDTAPIQPYISSEIAPGHTEEGKVASRLAGQILVAKLAQESRATSTSRYETRKATDVSNVSEYWFGTAANFKQLKAYAKNGHPYVIDNAKTFYVMAKAAGLSDTEVGCGENIIIPESSFDHTVKNPGSSAQGIGQALPGSKMAKFGPNWQTDVKTQIKWFLKYTGTSAKDKVKGRFNSVCEAWASRKNGGTY